ncbi:MAG: hypothetical protein ACREBD_21930, partial [Blastocatellia bacterium]
MGHTIPHDDRYERTSDAIDRITDGVKILWCIWREARANDQAETGARIVTPAQSERPLTLDELAARLG